MDSSAILDQVRDNVIECVESTRDDVKRLTLDAALLRDEIIKEFHVWREGTGIKTVIDWEAIQSYSKEKADINSDDGGRYLKPTLDRRNWQLFLLCTKVGFGLRCSRCIGF